MALDPLTAILNVGSQIIDKIFPDKTEAEKAKVRLAELASAGQLEEAKQIFELARGQQEINKTEALHASVFVSGWRPAVGWTCVAGFAWYYFIAPFAQFFIQVAGAKAPPLPILDMGELMTLLLGILGLGGLRTYERLKDKARET